MLLAASRVALASGGAAALAAAARSTDLPCAFHEAGHTILATHVAEQGIPCVDGAGQLVLHGTTPTLLKFTTITPRENPAKGVWYIGETKLTTRWRHMPEHARWQPGGAAPEPDVPQLQTSLFSEDLLAACTRKEPPRTLQTLLTVARIAYLMGGCAARA